MKWKNTLPGPMNREGWPLHSSKGLAFENPVSLRRRPAGRQPAPRTTVVSAAHLKAPETTAETS